MMMIKHEKGMPMLPKNVLILMNVYYFHVVVNSKKLLHMLESIGLPSNASIRSAPTSVHARLLALHTTLIPVHV